MYALSLESLESRRLLAVNVAVNFQPAGAGTPGGYVADTGGVYGVRNGWAYGWDKTVAGTARDKNSSKSPTQAHDTYLLMNGSAGLRKWEFSLPSGTYSVRVVSGEPTFDTNPQIKAEGVTVVSGATTSGNRFRDATKTITVKDGRLTLTASSSSINPINFVKITSAGTTPTPTEPTEPIEPTDPDPTPSGFWPGTGAWKLAAGSPQARFESHGIAYNSKLYVFGGWADGSFNYTKRVDVFNPATNTWTRKKDMPAPPTHSATALDASKGVLYFVGGHRGNLKTYTPTNEVWKYSFASDTYTKLSVTLPYKMGGGSAQIVDGKLYSFGGNYDDRVTNTADVFELDLSDLSAGFEKVGTLPSARDHLSSVVLGGKIYAVGGEFGHDKRHAQQSVLQRYDPDTHVWTRLASMPGAKSHAESSVFVLSGKIIFAGGQVSPQKSTKSVYSYDPSSNKWSTLASLPAQRQGTVVQKVGDYFVFTTGGIETYQPQKTTWTVKIA